MKNNRLNIQIATPIVLALALSTTATGQSAGGSITVEVGNVRSDKGTVIVDVCPKDQFLGDGCTYQGKAPAKAGTTVVTVSGVPAGQYAAQAFHDENSNGEVDQNFLGVPKEGIGFSRDAKIVLSPPDWDDAVFSHPGKPSKIGFKMRYMIGPSGPKGPRRR